MPKAQYHEVEDEARRQHDQDVDEHRWSLEEALGEHECRADPAAAP